VRISQEAMMTTIQVAMLVQLVVLLIEIGLLMLMWRMMGRFVFELEWNTAVMRQLGDTMRLVESKKTKKRK
jgi:hypothetical protein